MTITYLYQFAIIPSIGPGEWMAIIFVLLLLFGAKKLPQLARGMGKSIGEFKKAKDEFEHEIMNAEDEVTAAPSTSSPKESKPRASSDGDES